MNCSSSGGGGGGGGGRGGGGLRAAANVEEEIMQPREDAVAEPAPEGGGGRPRGTLGAGRSTNLSMADVVIPEDE